MAEHKHTPAPWEAVLDGGDVVLVEALTADRKLVTREICHVLDGGTPEDEANLKLIAAAPDLLAALQMLVEAAAHEADKSSSLSGYLGARLTDARTAIAKAVTRG